jgi:uncharacterized protein YecE (DUF72 family)
MEGLRDKAGPLVFQFSPQEVRSPARFADALHAFLSRLPRGPLYAVELRNPELLTAAYGAALVDAGAVHCFNAWSRMPTLWVQRRLLPDDVARTLVVRWLTRPGDTHADASARLEPFDRLREPDDATRDDVVSLVRDASARRAESFVLVDNKAEGCALDTIVRVAEALVTS